MKNIVFAMLISAAFFGLGYLYSNRSMLFIEYAESNSNAISRTFIERSSMYIMLRQGKDEKVQKVFESLIFGDLVAMEVIDFSNTSNAEIFCSRLIELKSFIDAEVIFNVELENLVRQCQ